MTSLLASPFSLGAIDLTVGDALGFATGLLCVWLTAKASIWNFAWGILNSAILCIVFIDQRLFADSALQVVFIVLSIFGWAQWANRDGAPTPGFKETTLREQGLLLATTVMLSGLLWQALVQMRGSAPLLDAVITVMSLSAQWQLNRKQVSCWAWWIAVDLVSIPLYWSRGLYLISALYVIFLLLCIFGWRKWRQHQSESKVVAA